MRLKRNHKMTLALALRDEALSFMRRNGEIKIIDGHQCLTFEGDSLRIIHSTPFTKWAGAPAPYGLDIWVDRKVYNFVWDPPEIIRFDYGHWMNKFIPGSYSE